MTCQVPVIIISAMKLEIAQLEKALEHPEVYNVQPFPYTSGTLSGKPVILCTGGVGKANAAAATAAMLERFKPEVVINTGCAGAYLNSGLAVGDIVIAETEIFGDEGAHVAEGWIELSAMELPLLKKQGVRYFNQIPLSQTLTRQALRNTMQCGHKTVCGKSVTVSSCSGTLQQGDDLAQRFQALCENMEGAAVALTCLRYGVECLEVRGISNMVEGRNLEGWDIELAVARAQELLIRFIAEMPA